MSKQKVWIRFLLYAFVDDIIYPVNSVGLSEEFKASMINEFKMTDDLSSQAGGEGT